MNAINGKNIIILYYKYVAIDELDKLANTQRSLCEKLGLKGRIILAKEGINGTLEGGTEAVAEYCEVLVSDSRFTDIHFKKSVGTEDGTAFPRLSVKVRNEIVSGHFAGSGKPDVVAEGAEDIDPTKVTGKRLKPEELRSWIESGKEPGRDFYIVDMRNDYESAVGHFAGSILPPLHNFRDLPEVVERYEELKRLKNGDATMQKMLNMSEQPKPKPIVTVCTGGVRCEKASGYLIKSGFDNVYQLDGGIVSYMEKYPGHDFLGSLYVFDKRHTMHFTKRHVVIGRCALCAAPSEKYTDCKNDRCHAHFITCADCADQEGRAFCSLCESLQVTTQVTTKQA